MYNNSWDTHSIIQISGESHVQQYPAMPTKCYIAMHSEKVTGAFCFKCTSPLQEYRYKLGFGLPTKRRRELEV